jgi:glycosyltransferase involved in cell wall biosynthesis
MEINSMNILIFMTQFYQLGGAERLDVELAEELNKRGIKADILSMYTEDLPGVAEAKKDLLRRGIPNVHFLNMKIHSSPMALIPAIFKLRRLIRDQEYDIVETSMLSPTVIASWATRHSCARHIAGIHQVFNRDRENSNQHKFWRFSVRHNPHTRYYAISDFVRNAWIHYSGVLPQHVRTIYNAISNIFFNVVPERLGVRAELKIPNNSKIALYVGRLVKYKGCEILINALGPILKQYNIQLLYVGFHYPMVEDSRIMLKKIKDKIKKNGWENHVHFLGFRKDIPRLMASSDLLVHPTFMEGFGLTIIEALATGLPVITTDIEAIPEILAGTDSIMVPPNNPDALRKAVLVNLKQNEQKKAEGSSKGLLRANDFHMDTRINNFIRILNDVNCGSF